MRTDTQTLNSSELRNRFGQMLDDALRGRATIVERFGRPAGVFVPVEVYEAYLEWARGTGSPPGAEEGPGT